MHHAFLLTGSFLAGLGLSIVYFGGLWLTVQMLSRATRPGLLALSSFVGRLALALAGFYLVLVYTDGRWEGLAVCLLGFVGGRTLLLRRWRPLPAQADKTETAR